MICRFCEKEMGNVSGNHKTCDTCKKLWRQGYKAGWEADHKTWRNSGMDPHIIASNRIYAEFMAASKHFDQVMAEAKEILRTLK